jgi:hypothetical protein
VPLLGHSLRRSVRHDVGQFGVKHSTIVVKMRHIHSVVLNRHRCRQKQYLQFLCASSGRSSKMSTLETARDIARCAPQSSNFRTAATPRKKVVCFALSIYNVTYIDVSYIVITLFTLEALHRHGHRQMPSFVWQSHYCISICAASSSRCR